MQGCILKLLVVSILRQRLRVKELSLHSFCQSSFPAPPKSIYLHDLQATDLPTYLVYVYTEERENTCTYT